MSTERRRRDRAGELEGTDSEEVITYKRKRAWTDAEGDGTSVSAGGEDDFTRVDFHCRNVLERLLLLSEMSKGGGTQSCIWDALIARPSGFAREFKMTDVPMETLSPKVRCNGHCKIPDNSQGQSSSVNAYTGGSAAGASVQANDCVNTTKCENILLDVLHSENFASFCDLLSGNFEDSKGKDIFNFSLIYSKLRNGDYEQSTELFYQDIQQVWQRFLKIGQEMALLANRLLDISWDSYQKQVGKCFTDDSGELIIQGTSRSGLEQKKTVKSLNLFPSCRSTHFTKPDNTEASFPYRVRACKHCGIDADSRHSLICDECEGMYHHFCVKPFVRVIPSQSWYCASCSSKGKLMLTKKRGKSIPESPVTNMQDSLHKNCAVCDRLELSETQIEHKEGDKAPANDSGDSTISSMESSEPPQPSKNAVLRLCKQCGTAENKDKRFLVCGNSGCHYKFYHIRCLKNSQIAMQQQQSQNCWYCPSCLCRACLTDKDDGMIVMCDGCDEAYHTYCMKPPLTSVPKGNWYCIPCNVKRAWQGMRRYEQWILQQHKKKDECQTDGAMGSVDNISSSSKKLTSEEKLTGGKAYKRLLL